MDLTSVLLTPLRWLGAGVCNIIYFLISRLFQLFMIVSQLNILSSDEIGPIYERITLILTIVMVFYITFEFVKYVVQPDSMTDKEKGVGNIVKRMIIAIVLIAFVPRIFTMAYDLQNKLITNQVFSKIILGEKNIEFDTFGSAFSADMLGVFYGLDEKYCSGSDYDDKCQEAETKVEDNLAKLREGNEVTIMPGLTDTKDFTVDGENEKVFPIRFDGLLAIIIGGVILYLVVLYTIDVGTRYAQLIFLQIMSPIAIIGYISPKKDNIFSKWLKQCITTYLDLFIRLAIIYFVLLIIDVLGDSFTSGSLFAGVEGVDGYKTLVYIVLVMGLLVFAQKAPKMLGELLPGGGGAASIGYGLEASKRVAPMAARAIGASAGGLNTLVRRGIARFGKEQKRRQEIKDKLLKEGKPYDRRTMRRALQQDRAQDKRNKQDLKTKKGALEAAREELVKAENRLKIAGLNMDTNSNEYKEIKKQADNARTKFNNILSGTADSNIRDRYIQAQERLRNAKETGEYDKMSKEKQQELNNELAEAQKKWAEKAGYEELQRAQQQSADKLAQAKRDNLGTPIGLQVAGAAASGLFTGIKTGGEATKLGDIGKKIQEATKQSLDKEKARIEWLEAGGGATIDALVSKKITEIQQKFGFETQAERIKLTINEIEKEVKQRDSQIAMESNVKKGQDDAEKRAEGKISKREQVLYVKESDELKYTIDGKKQNMVTTNADGTKMSTSQVYMSYQEKANTAKAQSEAANAELIKAEMEGRATDDMKKMAAEKSKEAERAKLEAEQVLKSLKEYAITRALRGDYTPNDKIDAVLLNQVEAMKDAMNNARNNAVSVEHIRSQLIIPSLLETEGKTAEEIAKDKDTYDEKKELFERFVNDQIKSYDDYDKIQGFLTGHTGTLTLEKNRLNETIRAIKESAETDAANANASAGGNKK